MTSLIRTNSGFAGIPKIKLSSSKTNLMRENLLELCQKQSLENVGLVSKISTPNSVRPQSKQGGAVFLTPKESKAGKDSPLLIQKSFNETKQGVFSDYYNQQYQQQQNKLPSININKSNLNRYSQKQLEESNVQSPGVKFIRQKTNTISSEQSNYDQNSNASTQDNLDKIKGKSTFFRLKAQSPTTQPLVKAQGDQSELSVSNYNSVNLGVIQNLDNDKFQQYYSTNQSPPNTEQTAFLFKQQQQQLNIKTIYEEQKKQLQRVEDLISPFPPKSTRKRLTRMSLNVNTTSDITFLNQQVNVLQEQIGGEKVLNKFVWDLIYAMKKNEYFDLLLEEYHNQLSKVHEKISTFFMHVFTDNINGILNSIQDFLSTFNAINDCNVFSVKIFLIEFLTVKSGVNNAFIDKQLAYKLIECVEVFRPQLTSNDELMNLYDISIQNLCNNIIENFVTSEFFKKYELEKIKQFARILIDLLFNKISCQFFISQFEITFSVQLTVSHINLLKDTLKKSLSELKEYNSIFRKNISYQLKKIQWLIPSSPSNQSYIDIVQNCPDLFTIMNKVIISNQCKNLNHGTFNSFLKIFYNKYNVFNMVDIFQVFKVKNAEKSRENIGTLVSLLKQTLVHQKVSSDLAKKIEIFTLSIFE